MQHVTQTQQVQTTPQVAQTAMFLGGFSSLEAALAAIVVLVGWGVSFGKIKSSIGMLTDAIKNDIKPELKNINASLVGLESKVGHLNNKVSVLEVRMTGVEGAVSKFEDRTGSIESHLFPLVSKMEEMWRDRLAPTHSPRQLNAQGEEILNTSGIKNIIDRNKVALFELVQATKPHNAYTANQAIQDVLARFVELFPQEKSALEDGAFRTGSEIQTVLFVGSIYLRDEIFEELGFLLDGTRVDDSADLSQQATSVRSASA